MKRYQTKVLNIKNGGGGGSKSTSSGVGFLSPMNRFGLVSKGCMTNSRIYPLRSFSIQTNKGFHRTRDQGPGLYFIVEFLQYFVKIVYIIPPFNVFKPQKQEREGGKKANFISILNPRRMSVYCLWKSLSWRTWCLVSAKLRIIKSQKILLNILSFVCWH